MSLSNRVVITGMGMVSPVGNSATQSWDNILNKKSGISTLDRFSTEGFQSHVAGLVKDEQSIFDAVLTPSEQRKTDRFIHFAVAAGHEALSDAQLLSSSPYEPHERGVYFGVGLGGLDTISTCSVLFQEKGPRAMSPFMIPKVISNEACSWLSMKYDLQGPSLALASACASGTDAIGHAYYLIKSGQVKCMVTGGAEACVTPVAVAAFGNMRVLSSWSGDPAYASRPFSHDRCGFVIGEGSGVLVLESEQSARARGARIYAEIVGYGHASDAYHLAAMHPQGRGAYNAITGALRDARINSEDIDYINAHGTATAMNDTIEIDVVRRVFGDRCSKAQRDALAMSSTKSMTGHLLGGAGGIETAFTARALYEQVLPPTLNCDMPDETMHDIDFVPESRKSLLKYALSNSFGFGGSNAVLALKKY